MMTEGGTKSSMAKSFLLLTELNPRKRGERNLELIEINFYYLVKWAS